MVGEGCFKYVGTTFWGGRLLFETGFLCNNPGCPGPLFADQAGLKLTEIHLPLPPKCWIKGVLHHRLTSSPFFKVSMSLQ